MQTVEELKDELAELREMEPVARLYNLKWMRVWARAELRERKEIGDTEDLVQEARMKLALILEEIEEVA